MTILVDAKQIRLVGHCAVEDAEPLMVALQSGGMRVDLSEATVLHTAVAQLLLAAHCPIDGLPSDPFLRGFLVPRLIEDNLC